MLGFVVSQTTVLLSHALQFAVLLATFTNLTQYTFYTCWSQRRLLKESHWIRFGPAYLVAAATMFIMVHPTYLVLRVARKADELTASQKTVLQLFTILGYVLLTIGIAWATNLVSKIRSLWQEDSSKEL